MWRIQRMFSRIRRRAASRKRPTSKRSMPKAFTTRLPLSVSCRIWFSSPRRDWLDSTERRIRRPSLRDRPKHHGNVNGRSQSHPPVGQQQDHRERYEGKQVLEKRGQRVRKRAARAVHVVDDRGHQPPGRLRLEETDGLAHQFFINLVAQIGGRGLTDVLNLHDAEIFGHRLDHKQKNQGDAEDRPDVVDAAGHEGIQIDDATAEGQLEQRQARVRAGGIQDAVEQRRDHQRDQALGQAHQRQGRDARHQPRAIRPHVAQQPPKLVNGLSELHVHLSRPARPRRAMLRRPSLECQGAHLSRSRCTTLTV